MPRDRQRSLLAYSSGAACLFALVMGVFWSGTRAARAGDDGQQSTKAEKSTSAEVDPAQVEFFEKSVRPILAARCHECHGPDKQKGGLRLDARTTVLAGGSTGPAVVPGKPDESLLVDAINYGEANHMPPKSKLPAGEIATLTEWVKRGAPWGIDASASLKNSSVLKGSKLPGVISKEEFQARAQYWSFQPLRRVPIPEARATQKRARPGRAIRSTDSSCPPSSKAVWRQRPKRASEP